MSFIILSVFFGLIIYYHNYGTSIKPFENDILIPLGTIYTEKEKMVKQPVYESKRVIKPKIKPKKVHAPIPVIPIMQKSPLFDDSVLALTKLGYKMSDAKSIANKLIGEGVSDLNELIIRAFKR
jgi:hypothetical protein